MPSFANSTTAAEQYAENVNPQWVRLLNLLQMDVRYTQCRDIELFTDTGERILDFLSGYCVHNAGHNHPRIIDAVKDELDRKGPAMLQSHVPELAGTLAARLCERAGGKLTKAFFCSSAARSSISVLRGRSPNMRHAGCARSKQPSDKSAVRTGNTA